MRKSNTAALLLGVGAIAAGALVKKLWLEKYRKQKEELAAAGHEREMLYRLLKLKQAGVLFSEYFTEYHLRSAAILGMGREGRFLIDELAKEGGISLAYGVEADHFGAVHEKLTVYRLGEDELPSADCLVVCDLNGTRDRTAAIQKEFAGTIVALEEVIDWLMDEHKIKKRRREAI